MIAEIASAPTIRGLRPRRSEMALDASSETAIAAVASDKDKLLCAGVSANALDSSGIKGCTQYNNAKQEKPPKNMARLVGWLRAFIVNSS
jgi:hypothetical protein